MLRGERIRREQEQQKPPLSLKELRKLREDKANANDKEKSSGKGQGDSK